MFCIVLYLALQSLCLSLASFIIFVAYAAEGCSLALLFTPELVCVHAGIPHAGGLGNCKTLSRCQDIWLCFYLCYGH